MRTPTGRPAEAAEQQQVGHRQPHDLHLNDVDLKLSVRRDVLGKNKAKLMR